MQPDEELTRLCRRFEIAVGNFGRSCVSLKANEKAFQAWYAACVIQEFGLSRVYREVHLGKEDLFALAGRYPLMASLRDGNELFPDLSVSWHPDVDARHSSTRPDRLRNAGDMLRQFGILSELKVTGSTGNPTSPKWIRHDLAKLALFAAAHQAVGGDKLNRFATYMVLLDNFCNAEGCACPHYCQGRLDDLLMDIAAEWPTKVKKPTVILLYPKGTEAGIDMYSDFQRRVIAAEPTTTDEDTRVCGKQKLDAPEFLQRLATAAGRPVAEFMQQLLHEAESHKLAVVWRAAGPALHYKHPNSPQRFSLGFFDHRGCWGFGWLDSQCDRAGLSSEIGSDYFEEMARILPGAKTDDQPIVALAARKKEWWAAVDRMVERIRQGLD